MSFIDVRIFGTAKTVQASKTGIPPKFQTKEDRIHIFLNLKKVGEFVKKEDAQKLLNELILKSPENLELLLSYLKI